MDQRAAIRCHIVGKRQLRDIVQGPGEQPALEETADDNATGSFI